MIDCTVVDAANPSVTVATFATTAIPAPGDILEVKALSKQGVFVSTKWQIQAGGTTWRVSESYAIAPARLCTIFVTARNMDEEGEDGI